MLRKRVVADAVRCELVSVPAVALNRENNRENCSFEAPEAVSIVENG
jgi:hypothetical protein